LLMLLFVTTLSDKTSLGGTGWLGGITVNASDQRSEGCGFEAY